MRSPENLSRRVSTVYRSAYAHTTLSFVILGLTFVFTGTIWCMILALGAARLSVGIKRNYNFKIWMDRFTGLVFVFLGIKLALMKKCVPSLSNGVGF